MTIKSIIEDIFDGIGVAFDRELFAAMYAANLRNGTHDRVRNFRGFGLLEPAHSVGFGLKPAGSAGWDRGYLAAVQEYAAAADHEEAA